ncbi:alpha/beta fold hydrolase [Ktedonospora formicarum]|uniref:Putative hydrolase YraK n=1 Tax=Ktedonospora formicarum TaxID=2778364 RepID=A0A8J3MTC1_9CHLR|nr:alpha/beta hydrolase [Ktedonospora formicarum]GHO48072.1 putative hydrolase YraK [Ktedonospora formicarum]
MSKGTSGLIQVPGAQLYYEARGSGPVLFIIAGGSGDAESFQAAGSFLEPHFTILSYDRRGYARSPLGQPGEVPIVSIETQSDDAHRLLAALTTEPAYVFGSSLGALIGLDLVMRHQEQIRLLVAHEPPLRKFLEEEPSRGLRPRRNETPEQTIQRFAASLGLDRSLVHDESGQARAMAPERKRQNAAFFIYHEAQAVNSYELDLDGLRHVKDKILFGGGAEGREYFPYRGARKAAEVLDVPFVEFPGKHGGYGEYPAPFAEKLREYIKMSK